MRTVSLFLLVLACAPLPAQNSAQSVVKLEVDATDAPRRLFHAHLTMPAKPGPLTLLYPQWIPGEHAPTGPIANVVGLKIQGGGQTIAWKRDSVNMFAFHLEVPQGVSSLEISFDFISSPDAESGSFAAGATTQLAVVNWYYALLYPQGAEADSIQYQASLRVPNGWRYGTALPIQRESGNLIEFQPASLTTLADSPVSAGAHYRTIDLGNAGGAQHYLHVAADSDRALQASPEVVNEYKNLVQQAQSLFRSHHYRSFHFLLTLSDNIGHGGLEHHESNDDRAGERMLVDADSLKAEADLLPHEFVNSWNGKFRRPAGLASTGHDGGYDTPMKGDLLWVYEGLTEYLGEVLTPRSGLWSAEDFRDALAITAAGLDHRYGRTWRPLEDTAVAAQMLYDAGTDYSNYRRGVDFYPEGTLIWLEADVTIRQLSHGAKSIEDFCRAFHGGGSGRPEMKTYTFEDVVAGLNAVQPYDWAGFFRQRLQSTSAHAPLGGIEHAGWKLTYDGVRSEYWKATEDEHKLVDLSYSIGIKVKQDDASIVDVQMDSPAQKAGIAPAVKVIAVNGRQYNPTVLREAVAKTAEGASILELLVKAGDYYETHRIEYRGGEKYPHLVRDSATPDLLSEIAKPK